MSGRESGKNEHRWRVLEKVAEILEDHLEDTPDEDILNSDMSESDLILSANDFLLKKLEPKKLKKKENE